MVMEEKSQKKSVLSEVVVEIKKITAISCPIAAMSLVNYVKNMILVMCMGRLGSLELAGGALAVGFTNITGYSVLSGLAMGMEPLCGQAFGSGNLSLLTLTLRRTILMLLLTSIPIALLWFNLSPLMLAVHQNPNITKTAAIYCRFAIPDLIANSFLHPLRIYLRSKGTTWPLLWCGLIAIIFHFPLTFFLAFYFSLGVPGIAIANFATNFNTLFFILCYIFFTKSPKVHDKKPLDEPLITTPHKNMPLLLETSTRQEWGILLQMAIPSCVAVCLEWWWYEFMTILAGYLHNPTIALATSALVIQTTSLLYTLPVALSASVSTRIGNELGAGRPAAAKLAAEVAIVLALLVSTLGLFGTTLGKEAWGRVFTEDIEVLELTKTVLPIIGLCELANCPQTTGCGILRGSARPGFGAKINFYSFYVVGAPLAVFLAFLGKLGFVGLCYGLLGAQVTCAVSILRVVFKTDWEKESLKAEDLVGIKSIEHEEEGTKIIRI